MPTEYAAAGGHVLPPLGDAPAGDSFAMLPLGQVVPSLTNPRQTSDPARLQELADSIAATGVHQPILVRPLPAARVPETAATGRAGERPAWEIVAGERRWRASQLAGAATIPAMVRALTDVQVLEIQIIENLQREDLSPLEEAEGYQRLVDQTGTPKENIGAKIGKSRSYVYARLKLLDLDEAGREALRTGAIDASRALLIARIPDPRLQAQALERAAGTPHVPPMSQRQLHQWVQTNVMLSLSRTRFDITDATLDPAAGACRQCPKRTGANPDLWADADGPDLCTDPACYHGKEKATDERRLEDARRTGRRVIEGDEAEKLFTYASSEHWLKGYYPLDARPAVDLHLKTAAASLREALGKHCPPEAATVLAQHPRGGTLVDMIPVARANAIIAKYKLAKPEPAAKGAKDAKAKDAKPVPIEERPEFAERWRKLALYRADAGLTACEEVPTELLRASLVDRAESYHDEDVIGELLGGMPEPFAKADVLARLATLEEDALPALFLRLMLRDEGNPYAPSWRMEERQAPRTPLFELLHIAGVDPAEVRAEVRRQMESEDRAAELEAQGRASAKAQASKTTSKTTSKTPTKPAGSAPAPRYRDPATGQSWTGRGQKPAWVKAAIARGHRLEDFDTTAPPKTTAADAQAGIAHALQAAEGSEE